MKRILWIGVLVLLAVAGVGWIVLNTRGVDYADFQTRFPKLLEGAKIPMRAYCSMEPEAVALPRLVQWNPRFWNEPKWVPMVGRVHGWSGCEHYECELHGTRLRCYVRHTAKVMQYAEIHYEWDYEEVPAEELGAVLAREFPGLVVRTRKGPVTTSPVVHSVLWLHR